MDNSEKLLACEYDALNCFLALSLRLRDSYITKLIAENSTPNFFSEVTARFIGCILPDLDQWTICSEDGI